MTPPLRTTLGVDGDTRDHGAAEHLVHAVGEVLAQVAGTGSDRWASTHVVRVPDAHTAVALSWADPGEGAGPPARADVLCRLAEALPGVALVLDGASAGPPELLGGARAARGEHRARRAGRLVDYPGRAAVERVTTPAAVEADSGVDAVEGLAGSDVRRDAALDLTGFARPVWREGRCVLLVQPGRGGLVAFEQRVQIPCCSAH